MGRLSQFAKTGIGKPIHALYMAVKKPIVHISHIKEINKIRKVIKETDKIIMYCGVCESSNMGDLAQTYCTHKWLSENYSDYFVIDCKSSLIMDDNIFIDSIKPIVNKEVLFFFQSGYNTHDLGGWEDLMHQKIISNFPDNIMIMLPQTVYFKSIERKNQCSKVYNSHSKLLFFARDYQSEIIAKEMFPSLRVEYLPDIVSSLIGRFNFSQSERNKILLCRRHDVEQYYSENDYKEMESILSKIDITEVEDTILTDRNKKINANIENYIRQLVDHFATYKLVVTDKFHGLIFSLISNTPVIVIKTKDHKVTAGYELFHRHFPENVFYADDMKEIATIASGILNNSKYNRLDSYYYERYYKNLKQVIDDWIDTLK